MSIMQANQIYMNMHKTALADMKEARARLPAVAVPKKEKRHAIAQHMAAWTDARTGEYCYWQPLQTAEHPFKMWALALRFNYQIFRYSPSKW